MLLPVCEGSRHPKTSFSGHMTKETLMNGNRPVWVGKLALASFFGVSVRTTTNWMQRRVIPYVKIGRTLRFNLADCERAVRSFEMTSAGVRSKNGSADPRS